MAEAAPAGEDKPIEESGLREAEYELCSLEDINPHQNDWKIVITFNGTFAENLDTFNKFKALLGGKYANCRPTRVNNQNQLILTPLEKCIYEAFPQEAVELMQTCRAVYMKRQTPSASPGERESAPSLGLEVSPTDSSKTGVLATVRHISKDMGRMAASTAAATTAVSTPSAPDSASDPSKAKELLPLSFSILIRSAPNIQKPLSEAKEMLSKHGLQLLFDAESRGRQIIGYRVVLSPLNGHPIVNEAVKRVISSLLKRKIE